MPERPQTGNISHPGEGAARSPFAYCPACRSANIAFEEHKRLVCRDCDFHYYHNVATAVGAIIRCGDEVLFAVRGRAPAEGMLDLPGGFCDPGESLEQALNRELQEELGLQLEGENLRYLFSFANTYPYRDVVYRTTDVIFEVCLSKKPEIRVGDDVAAIRWLEPGEIAPEAIAFESIRAAVTLLQQRAAASPGVA